jgi:hypothetical protein
MAAENPIVWVHADCLSPTHPALLAHPGAPAVFVFDEHLLAHWQISLKRVQFMYECLLEMPVTILKGDVAERVLAFAQINAADCIVTTASPAPRFRQIATRLRAELPVTILEPDPFLDYDGQIDLGRFSRYWRTAEKYAFDIREP